MPDSHIMIVDDNPANLRLLEEMLTERGHQVHSFPLGRLALAAAAETHPDLVLLDINMPEMSGYEVCKRFKGAPELADIPIIFLSALNDTQDKIEAFRSGAVDYISKPFQFEEVHARVETHLKLNRLQRELKAHNEQLEMAVAARTHELAEALDRLTILDRSKSDFLNLISHEFRTPLHGLLGVSELILEERAFTPETHELKTAFDQSRRRILSILDDALLLAEIDVNAERFRPSPVSLKSVLDEAMERMGEFVAARNVSILVPAFDDVMILGHADLLSRALQALLETAVKLTRQGAAVRVTCDVGAGVGIVLIDSEGSVVPEYRLSGFFDVFSIGEALTPGGDLGLGPPVAHRILSLFGASVSARNRDAAGIRMTVLLPEPGGGRTVRRI